MLPRYVEPRQSHGGALFHWGWQRAGPRRGTLIAMTGNYCDDFAQAYDAHAREWGAGDLAPFARDVYQRRRRRGPGEWLDLCCGAGQVMAYAREMGIEAVGVDISPSMLKIARARTPDGQFHEADAASLRLGRRFELVSCMGASVSHFTELAKLAELFASAARHLKPGGLFIFDCHTPEGLEANGDRDVVYEDGDRMVAIQLHHDAEREITSWEATCFTREADGRYRRSEQRLDLRGYGRGALEQAIREAGLKSGAFYDAHTLGRLRKTSHHLIGTAWASGT